MIGLAEWLPVNAKALSATDQITIAMLKNIIANIEAGNLTVLDKSGFVRDNATAELTLILNGHPDPKL